MRKYPSGVSLVKARSGTGRLWPGQMIGLALSLAPAADERAGADDEAAAAAAAGCGEASTQKGNRCNSGSDSSGRTDMARRRSEKGGLSGGCDAWHCRCVRSRQPRALSVCATLCVSHACVCGLCVRCCSRVGDGCGCRREKGKKKKRTKKKTKQTNQASGQAGPRRCSPFSAALLCSALPLTNRCSHINLLHHPLAAATEQLTTRPHADMLEWMALALMVAIGAAIGFMLGKGQQQRRRRQRGGDCGVSLVHRNWRHSATLFNLPLCTRGAAAAPPESPGPLPRR